MKANSVVALLMILGVSFSCARSNERDAEGEGERVDADLDAAIEAGVVLDSAAYLDVSDTNDVNVIADAASDVTSVNDDDSGQEGDGDDVVCNRTKPLLDNLFYLCYKDSKPCANYHIRARLYLDVRNGPFHWYSDGTVVIENGSGFVVETQCGGKAETRLTQIAYRFNHGENFDLSYLPGLRAVPEWKVEINSGGIEYCESCYTMEGQLPEFWFRGSLDDVEFIKDTKDELPPFIEVTDAEGNLIADIR